MDIRQHNENAWDGYVEKKDRWTLPVSEKEIEDAKNGSWGIVLTPKQKVPHGWFPPLQGCNILGLAAGGGQQCPILAALGAHVTLLDNSERQLQQDRTVSEAFNLGIKTVKGDMRSLDMFNDASFDLVFNPCSVLFVDNVRAVWTECARVLKPGGILMTGLMNPIAFQLCEETQRLLYPQPFSDIHSLPKDKLAELLHNNEALVFGHTLSDQIGGQLEAGFAVTDMYEDSWGGSHPFDAFFPAFIATRAVKKTM